jgi:hypothetical protein
MMRRFQKAGARNHYLVRPRWRARGFIVGADGKHFVCGILQVAKSVSFSEPEPRLNYEPLVPAWNPNFVSGFRYKFRMSSTIFLIRRVFFTRTGCHSDRKRYRQFLPGRLLNNEINI